MKKKKNFKAIFFIVIVLISFFKIYSLIVDQFDRTNYCYMLMYGRIEEERGDIECWKE